MMQPALDYLLGRLYATASNDLAAYHAHIRAVEDAFDFTQDDLAIFQDRAKEVKINVGPFCWKHVDVVHGLLLEDVKAGTVLMTHKPVMVMPGRLHDSDMHHYAQCFFVTFVMWPLETVNNLVNLYCAAILKNQETMDAYAIAVSLAVTWADALLADASRSNEEWNRRFAAFGILSTKCIPCPHTCGRVLIMSADYFEQINESETPNAMMTPHLWSLPFGVFEVDSDLCRGHLRNQVTFANHDIVAGKFVSIPMQNPFVLTDHPSHRQHPDSASMCRSVLEMGSLKMEPTALQKTLLDLTTVVAKQLQCCEDRETSPDWPSPFSSVALASANALGNVLQQSDYAAPETCMAISILAAMIPKLQLPWPGWYIMMLLDVQEPRFAHPHFDSWRAALRAEADARWSDVPTLCKQIKALSF